MKAGQEEMLAKMEATQRRIEAKKEKMDSWLEEIWASLRKTEVRRDNG
jgi:hypothetical protein